MKKKIAAYAVMVVLAFAFVSFATVVYLAFTDVPPRGVMDQ